MKESLQGAPPECAGNDETPQAALAGAILDAVFTGLSEFAERQHDAVQRALDSAEFYLAGRWSR